MCSGFCWGGFLRFWYVQKKRVRHHRQSVARPKHKLGGATAALSATQKTEVYETLSSLNIAFAGIVQRLQKLQRTGPFKPESVKLFSGLAQELQAEINQDFLEDLHQLELDDWNRYGKVRDARDKELRDPDDVFIHAKERKHQLAKQRKRQLGHRKKRLAKHRKRSTK